MSPCLTPLSPLTREGLVKEGGWLFKTVPISIQRETSSHYDRSNPDWSGQVFYFGGVSVAYAIIPGGEFQNDLRLVFVIDICLR